jgi:hypothetical protein
MSEPVKRYWIDGPLLDYAGQWRDCVCRAEAVAILETERDALQAERDALANLIAGADVLAVNDRIDKDRDWWSGGTWLGPNYKLVIVDRDAFDKIRKVTP